MKVSGTESMKMMMTFWGGDCGRDTFEILIDGVRLELFSPKVKMETSSKIRL